MKRRILNKKLKKDVLINLWIKNFNHTLYSLQSHMFKINQKDYKDKTSLWYCQFKIFNWIMHYEFRQTINIGSKKYNVKERYIYDYLIPGHFLTYKQYKDLINLD
jgi:hypothetical protein